MGRRLALMSQRALEHLGGCTSMRFICGERVFCGERACPLTTESLKPAHYTYQPAGSALACALSTSRCTQAASWGLMTP